MKRTSLILFALTASWVFPYSVRAEVIIKQDFEADTVPQGPSLKWYKYGDHFLGIADQEEYPFAGGASKKSESAIVITGGVDDPHAWQPAADYVLPDLEGGYLKISFQIRNGSPEAADCLFQIWGTTGGDKESLYQSLWFNSNYVRASGTEKYMFKNVTSGESSDWHEVVWTIPMPGTEGVASLEVDGDAAQPFVESPPEGFDQLKRFRFFLQMNKAEDVKFAIDDVVIEHVDKP